MFLGHRVGCPIQAIENELTEERETHFPTKTKMLFGLPVHQKQMVAIGLAANIDILSHFDIAFGSQNDGPTISPGTQTSGGEPIHSEIGGRTIVSNQGSVAEIFEFRILLVRVVGHSC